MHLKQKLTFMAFGSILTLAGYLLATLVGDVTALDEFKQEKQPSPVAFDEIPAQSEKDKTTVFDKIVCRELQIVDADGRRVVHIDEVLGGGYISVDSVDSVDGENRIFITANSVSAGMVFMHRGKLYASIGKGRIALYSQATKGSIQLGVNEYGGRMKIFGNTDDKTRVLIGINERGYGTINTWDKNGYRTRP